MMTVSSTHVLYMTMYIQIFMKNELTFMMKANTLDAKIAENAISRFLLFTRNGKKR